MPQASDELRAKIKRYFGDPVSDAGPLRFLRHAGFMDRAGVYYHKPRKRLTQKELDCLNFLVDEWDYAYDFTSSGSP